MIRSTSLSLPIPITSTPPLSAAIRKQHRSSAVAICLVVLLGRKTHWHIHRQRMVEEVLLRVGCYVGLPVER